MSAASLPAARAERVELVRNRLIESRLTPNAISMVGLVGNLAAAVLVWQRYFFLAGIAFILGSIMDTLDGRYSRDVGQGHAVRRVPGLDARPHGGGHRAHRGRRLLRGPPATHWPSRPTVAAVLFSLMVSDTRARAEALGVDCKVGLAQRRSPRGHPLDRPAVRQGRRAGRLRAAGPVGLRARRADDLHDVQRIAHVRKELLDEGSRGSSRSLGWL